MSNLFLRKAVVFPITAYQYLLSPDTGLPRFCGLVRANVCGQTPSCSEYAKNVILAHGIPHGVFLGIKRILSCHPYKVRC